MTTEALIAKAKDFVSKCGFDPTHVREASVRETVIVYLSGGPLDGSVEVTLDRKTGEGITAKLPSSFEPKVVGKSFSKEAQAVLCFANAESQSFGVKNVSSEHLFLAILSHGNSLGARVCAKAGLRIDAVRDAARVQPMSAETSVGGYSTSIKRALSVAGRHADALRQREVNPDHLMLGTLDEPGEVLGKIFQQLAFDAVTVKQTILAQLSE